MSNNDEANEDERQKPALFTCSIHFIGTYHSFATGGTSILALDIEGLVTIVGK